jgi:RNA polymerase sigma-70 factor (ECF subfamily)
VQADRSSEARQLEALRAGHDGAFDGLLARWQRPLFAFAWRYLHNRADAEDVVIETFVRLHEQRTRLRADTNLSAWLFTTLANLCHNHHRWRTRHPETSLERPPAETNSDVPPVELAAATPAANQALENSETALALRAPIEQLPHDQKTVLLLHHYEHLSYREIGAVVGCAERGVETRLYRARQQLRAELTPFLREALRS